MTTNNLGADLEKKKKIQVKLSKTNKKNYANTNKQTKRSEIKKRKEKNGKIQNNKQQQI